MSLSVLYKRDYGLHDYLRPVFGANARNDNGAEAEPDKKQASALALEAIDALGRGERRDAIKFNFNAHGNNENRQFLDRGVPIGSAKVHEQLLYLNAGETMEILYWQNPRKKGEYIVGFVQELWPDAQLRKSWPKTRLYSVSTHSSESAAEKARDELAARNTCGTLLAHPKKQLVSRYSRDLPFRPLKGWIDKNSAPGLTAITN